MFNLRLTAKEIGADLLGLIGDLATALAKGLGRMLAIILCGGVIGAVAGAVFSLTQDVPLLESLAIGGIGGAFVALFGIILVSFANAW